MSGGGFGFGGFGGIEGFGGGPSLLEEDEDEAADEAAGSQTILPVRDASSFFRMLWDLLPSSRFWEGAARLRQFLLASADELARIDGRVRDFVTEMDPREAVELLPDWERLYDVSSDGTVAERQARVYAARVARQRFRPIDVAQALAEALDLPVEDIVIFERSRAFAIACGDDQEKYRFFVYRDPTLPGTWSFDAWANAQTILDEITHSHAKGHVIESDDFYCDDEFSQCDSEFLGA